MNVALTDFTAAEQPELERELEQLNQKLAHELAKAAVDIAGFVDPTPISDAIGLTMSLQDGDWIGAGLSLVSMVPYVGDAVGKTAKGIRAAKKLTKLRARIAATVAKLEKLKKAGQRVADKVANAVKTGRKAPRSPPGACQPCKQGKPGTQRWKNNVTKSGRPYRKPGPKTNPNAPHNKKSREIIEREKKKGMKHIGGGNLPEKVVRTEGGKKPYRRMDASFKDPKTGKVTHYNVGKKTQKVDSSTGEPVPIKRERDAIKDVKTTAPKKDRDIRFEAYN